ncbi:hypothetical protein [Colwellia sp. MEBiC06753]
MKNISLLKLSAFVVIGAALSSVVKADNNLADKAKADAKANVAVEKSSVARSANVKADEVVAHTELFEPLDADKNGVITEVELGSANNELLKKEFKKIDVNADNGISQQELKDYLAKVELKTNI